MALRERPDAVRRREPLVLGSPFEFAVGLMCMIVAAANVRALLTYPPHAPHVGLFVIPIAMLWIWIISIGIGGAALVVGLLVGSTRPIGRAIEKSGLWLSLSAWLTLTVTAIGVDPTEWMQYGQFLALALGCALRLVALRRIERVIEAVVSSRREGE